MPPLMSMWKSECLLQRGFWSGKWWRRHDFNADGPSIGLGLRLRDVDYVSNDIQLTVWLPSGILKPAEIAKLENLKILSLSLCHLETTTATSSCIDVFELLRYLPKLQELGLDFHDYKLTEGGARKKFPTVFPSLKAIKLTRIGFSNGVMLSFALETIRHFSNLQTLEITGIMHHVDDPVPVSIPILEVEYNTMELRSVVFNDFKGSENKVYLLKYFLACSPSLKKIVIHPDWSLALGEQFMLAKKLLKLHRASAVAEIHFD